MDFMEDVDLDIHKNDWNEHWKMQIHLKVFLSDRNIGKTKKLLKIIRGSDTPDEEQKIKDFVQEFLNHADDEIAELEKYKIGYEQKVKYSKDHIADMKKTRDGFKKNSEQYKYWSGCIKAANVDLKQFKSRLGSCIRETDDILKNVMFCQKVIEILNS